MQHTQLQLSIGDAGASDERLQQITMDLATDLRRETDVNPRLPEAEGEQPGSRGAALEVGKLVVQLVSGGSVAALINVLAAHFQSKPKLSITVSDQNGRSVTVSGDNVSPEDMEQMLRRVLPGSSKE